MPEPFQPLLASGHDASAETGGSLSRLQALIAENRALVEEARQRCLKMRRAREASQEAARHGRQERARHYVHRWRSRL